MSDVSCLDVGALQRYLISCICYTKSDWDCFNHSIMQELVVGDNSCNESGFIVLDVSGCVSLKEVKVGNNCLNNVETLRITELRNLESVVFGNDCATKSGYDSHDGGDCNRHFYVKNCPKLKLLRIGYKSFADYSVCEIENVDALEVIEMGELNEDSFNFNFASLELKSILIHSE